MLSNRALTAGVLLTLVASVGHAQDPDTPVTMNEQVWIAFYDVPSRRFRNVRSAVERRDFVTARSDLEAAAAHLKVEASRAIPELAVGLGDAASRLAATARRIEGTDVTFAELDASFGRAHWLLAQHYLQLARQARDAGRNPSAGRYLWATTHHMERAVLWSNSRIDRRLRRTLDGLRELSVRLQDAETGRAALRDKPVLRAEKILHELGRQIDRPVVLPAE